MGLRRFPTYAENVSLQSPAGRPTVIIVLQAFIFRQLLRRSKKGAIPGIQG